MEMLSSNKRHSLAKQLRNIQELAVATSSRLMGSAIPESVSNTIQNVIHEVDYAVDRLVNQPGNSSEDQGVARTLGIVQKILRQVESVANHFLNLKKQPVLYGIGKDLYVAASALSNSLARGGSIGLALPQTGVRGDDERDELIYKMRGLLEDHTRSEERLKKALQDAISRISTLSGELKELHGRAGGEINKIRQSHEAVLEEIEQKNADLSAIIERKTSRSVAIDYEASAESERRAANWLRIGSIAVMMTIAGLIAYTLWETTHQGV